MPTRSAVPVVDDEAERTEAVETAIEEEAVVETAVIVESEVVVVSGVVDVSAGVLELVSVDVSVLVVSAGAVVSVAAGSVGVVPSPYAALGPMTSSIAMANANSVETKRARGFWWRNSTSERIRERPVVPAAMCFFICGAPMWRRPAGLGRGAKDTPGPGPSRVPPWPAEQPVKRRIPLPPSEFAAPTRRRVSAREQVQRRFWNTRARPRDVPHPNKGCETGTARSGA